jgi:hypothetical protein
MDINLTLNVEEVNAVLQTLGQLPTSSGAWPLVVKIKEQAEAQVGDPAQEFEAGE